MQPSDSYQSNHKSVISGIDEALCIRINILSYCLHACDSSHEVWVSFFQGVLAMTRPILQ